MKSVLATGRPQSSADVADAKGSRVHFVDAGTPQLRGENATDLRYVDAAIDALSPYLSEGDLAVGKSTVPVGTASRLSDRIVAASAASLAWNPEFLREGLAVKDTIGPERLVYGVPGGENGGRAKKLLNEVYATARGNGTSVVFTDYASPKLAKVSASAFLATKISFINAMAEIAKPAGADVPQLADTIGFDVRVAPRFADGGIAFGGGRPPKDIRAFVAGTGSCKSLAMHLRITSSEGGRAGSGLPTGLRRRL